MLRFLMFLVTTQSFCLKTFCQEKDSIFLYNGQVLIGDVQRAQLGEITIDDIDLKTVEIKLYKIRVLKTTRRFRIETNNEKFYFGTLKGSSMSGWVNIVSDDGLIIPVEIENLSLVVPLERNFFARMSGTLSAGFSYTKSSAQGQINLSSNIDYATRLVDYQLTTSENASIDSSGFSRDREEAGLQAAYSFTPVWFIAASSNYQRNLELSIARRFQQLIGAGNKIFLKRSWQLLALSGITFNQEKSTAGVSSGLLLEIPVEMRFNYFKYHHPNIQIYSSPAVYFSLSQKGRIRFDGNTSFSWELIRYFYLTINPYINFDNQPPEGNSNLDYGIVVSLSYKF